MPRAEPAHLTLVKHTIKTGIYCRRMSNKMGMNITPDHLTILYIVFIEPDLSQQAIVRTATGLGYHMHVRSIANFIDRCLLLGWITRTRHKHALLHNITLEGKTFLIDAERAIRKTRIPKHSAIDYRAKWIKAHYYRKKAANQDK